MSYRVETFKSIAALALIASIFILAFMWFQTLKEFTWLRFIYIATLTLFVGFWYLVVIPKITKQISNYYKQNGKANQSKRYQSAAQSSRKSS